VSAPSLPARPARPDHGAAEVGRELGDAGGPLIVAAAASAATLPGGLLLLAGLLAAGAAITHTSHRDHPSSATQGQTATAGQNHRSTASQGAPDRERAPRSSEDFTP